jgi:hypothetical protein
MRLFEDIRRQDGKHRSREEWCRQKPDQEEALMNDPEIIPGHL